MLAQDNEALIETLQEQLHQAYAREQQAQEREAQLLTVLQNEQAARHELEQRLLPLPEPKPPLIHPCPACPAVADHRPDSGSAGVRGVAMARGDYCGVEP